MKKKVLIVNTSYTGLTGITSVIMNYVKYNRTNVEYDFVLAAGVDPQAKNIFQNFGGRIFIPPVNRKKNPVHYYVWLKQLLKKNYFDVVHVHGNSGTMFFEIRAAKSVAVPIRIAHCHSSSCKHRHIHKLLKPWMNKDKTIGIACSDLAGKWLFNDDYVLLNNGIEISKYQFSPGTREQYRKQLCLENNFVIGHIGYMAEEKNHSYLLSIFRKVLQQKSNARLLLIGDGKLRNEIENQILLYGLKEYVHLLGKRSDAAQLYQCMDVFVLPSLFEGLPVSLIEAQTAGLHCVVSDKVTKQADLTGNITYLGIEQTNEAEWVSILCGDYYKFDRTEYADIMSKSDFNIDKCANILLSLYGIK